MKNYHNSKPLLFVGDIFASKKDEGDISKVIEEITFDSIFVANLEGAPEISERTTKNSKKITNLKFSKTFLSRISELKHVYFSIVNNHSTDNGLEGYEILKEILGDKSLSSSTKENDPRKYINGQSLLFFADEKEECLCSFANLLRFDLSVINAYSKFIDGSIIIVHGGIEYRRHPTFYQRKLSHQLIELGAHSVIFHHSHIMGVHEWFKDRLIHYGLGNFYFSAVNDMHGLDAIDGCALRLKANGIYEIAKIEYDRSNDNGCLKLNLNFEPLLNNYELKNMNQYKKWYSVFYKINASLRPRQLFSSEILNRCQYRIWYAFASRISRAGFSSRLKSIIRRFIVNKF